MTNKRFNFNVSFSIKLSIKADKLWTIISSKRNLELYHPFCKKNIPVKWPGVNSVDEIHYYNGDIYTRKFINWIENIGYDLYISKKKSNNSLVKWRIKKDNGNSILTITIYPYLFNTKNKFINFLPFYLFVKPILYNYLSKIGKGLIYHIKTKQKVNKNQFGSHIWFS